MFSGRGGGGGVTFEAINDGGATPFSKGDENKKQFMCVGVCVVACNRDSQVEWYESHCMLSLQVKYFIITILHFRKPTDRRLYLFETQNWPMGNVSILRPNVTITPTWLNLIFCLYFYTTPYNLSLFFFSIHCHLSQTFPFPSCFVWLLIVGCIKNDIYFAKQNYIHPN